MRYILSYISLLFISCTAQLVQTPQLHPNKIGIIKCTNYRTCTNAHTQMIDICKEKLSILYRARVDKQTFYYFQCRSL